MRTRQREPCSCMIERSRGPSVDRVASLAIGRKTTCHMVGERYAHEVRLVTAVTVR